VCDLTRKETLSELEHWIESAQSVTKEVPIVILGNKCDLEDQKQMEFSELTDFAKGYNKCKAFLSSVRTGHNVEHTYKTLSKMIIREIK
jgi:GTPase SAR1 family protein